MKQWIHSGWYLSLYLKQINHWGWPGRALSKGSFVDYAFILSFSHYWCHSIPWNGSYKPSYSSPLPPAFSENSFYFNEKIKSSGLTSLKDFPLHYTSPIFQSECCNFSLNFIFFQISGTFISFLLILYL